MNLTKVEGTYSKVLYENMPKLKAIYNDESKSISLMKNFVLLLIRQIKDTNARTRFIGYLKDCQTKKEVLALCNNTVHKAMKYIPVKNTV